MTEQNYGYGFSFSYIIVKIAKAVDDDNISDIKDLLNPDMINHLSEIEQDALNLLGYTLIEKLEDYIASEIISNPL